MLLPRLSIVLSPLLIEWEGLEGGALQATATLIFVYSRLNQFYSSPPPLRFIFLAAAGLDFSSKI